MRHLAIVILIAVAGVAPAAAETCEDEAAALRSHLEDEAGRAWRWNTIWAVAFGGAAAAQVTFAYFEVNPTGRDFEDSTRDTLYVGATKATLGFVAKLVLPLHVAVPATTGAPCEQVPALRAALAAAGRAERRSFWLTHLAGTALNLAGAAVLTYRHSLSVGALSFAISYPVGPISAYTQPRRSWKEWRARRSSWVVGASAGAGASVWLGGTW